MANNKTNNRQQQAKEGRERERRGGASPPAPGFSLPIALVMTTLIFVGLIGTLRMRKHALEGRQTLSAEAVTGGRLMTADELAMYDGRRSGSMPIYIGILGQVYDVTAGKQHYGPGGSYSFFAGRDASRAYVTGKFQDDLSDDVRDLKPQEFSGLVDWRSFYQKHKKYKAVGKVVGRMYDAQGVSTPLLAMVEMKAAEYDAQMELVKKKEASGLVPKTCSFKWHRDSGGQVSCGGGGYPRRVYDADKGRELCRCMPDTSVSDTVLMYEGCQKDATICGTKKTNTRNNQAEEVTSSEL